MLLSLSLWWKTKLITVGGFILAARWITISVVEVSCPYNEQNRMQLNLVTTTEVVS
jgi:hypothetical protein